MLQVPALLSVSDYGCADRQGSAASGMIGSQRDFEPPGGLERRDIQVCEAMEDEKSFSDICGGRLALRRRYYSPYCREFGLSSARLSLCSLTAVTCAVWLAAYGLFTLCEVKAGARPAQAAWRGLGADPWVREGGDSLDQGRRSTAGLPSLPEKFVLLDVLPQWTYLPCSFMEHNLLRELSASSRITYWVPKPTDSRRAKELQKSFCLHNCAVQNLHLISVSQGQVNYHPLSQPFPNLSAFSKVLPGLRHEGFLCSVFRLSNLFSPSLIFNIS